MDKLNDRVVVVRRVTSLLNNLARGVEFRYNVLNSRKIQYLQKGCDMKRGRIQRPINLDKVNLILYSNFIRVHNSLT